MRYLAVDLGQKRTGIAVGDSITGIVSPIEVLHVAAGPELLNAVAGVCVEHLGPKGQIVLGMPLNMDGTEGPAAKSVRDFGQKLSERTGRAVNYMDERLTSVQAEWELSGSGLTRGQKRDKRDALAAAAILKDFLSRQKISPVNTDPPADDPADARS